MTSYVVLFRGITPSNPNMRNENCELFLEI